LSLLVGLNRSYSHIYLAEAYNLERYVGEAWISFKISDTGIGMNAEQIERVFKAFTQADESPTRRYGSRGLGLAIAKKFCQMMGGDISVESELGKGSIFTVELPARVAEKAAS
jgi:signal transduction histidine kinase